MLVCSWSSALHLVKLSLQVSEAAALSLRQFGNDESKIGEAISPCGQKGSLCLCLCREYRPYCPTSVCGSAGVSVALRGMQRNHGLPGTTIDCRCGAPSFVRAWKAASLNCTSVASLFTQPQAASPGACGKQDYLLSLPEEFYSSKLEAPSPAILSLSILSLSVFTLPALPPPAR